MTILITFDGVCGSGKTTQMQRLEDYLLESGKHDVFIPERDAYFQNIRKSLSRFHKVRDSLSFGFVNRFTDVLDSLSVIKAQQNDCKLWKDKDIVLSDWYWNSIIQFGRDKNVLDAFQDLAKANNGYLPFMSFILRCSEPECRKRIRERSTTPHLEIFSYDESNYNESIEWLSSELGFVFIIDGMQSEDDVHQDIITSFEEGMPL